MENSRYEIQRKINEDKFSTTFKAYDKKLNRYLSFKEYNDNKYFEVKLPILSKSWKF